MYVAFFGSPSPWLNYSINLLHSCNFSFFKIYLIIELQNMCFIKEKNFNI